GADRSVRAAEACACRLTIFRLVKRASIPKRAGTNAKDWKVLPPDCRRYKGHCPSRTSTNRAVLDHMLRRASQPRLEIDARAPGRVGEFQASLEWQQTR